MLCKGKPVLACYGEVWSTALQNNVLKGACTRACPPVLSHSLYLTLKAIPDQIQVPQWIQSIQYQLPVL